MNTLLWIMQSLAAAMFLMMGTFKAFSSKEKLKQFSAPVLAVRLLGMLEILGAVGLIVPFLLNIYPHLTIIAAISLAAVMLGAIIFHIKRKEYKMLPLVSTLLTLCVVIFWNR